MRIIKFLIVSTLSVAVAVTSLWALQRLVVPKYDGTEYPLEGNFTGEYYEETTEHDVLMIGDCEVYENFDPITLWQEYGITSYIRGNAQQLTWQSYYMLEDALKYETPKVVIYNVQALTHAKPEREEYNRMTLDGMRWSGTKWDAIRASMCPGEKMIEYIFPLLRYHSRITELTDADFTYWADRRHVTCNGYYMRIDVLPVSQSEVADTSWLYESYPEAMKKGKNKKDRKSGEGDEEDPWADIEVGESEDPWADIDDGGDEGTHEPKPLVTKDKGEPFGELPMSYLDRMRTLCEEKGIRLILIKAPSVSPQWYDSQEKQVVDYSKKYNLPYINFYKLMGKIGLDYEEDTYDGGLHMNYNGAQKLSKWLGSTLVEEYKMPDHRVDSKLSEVYRKKVEQQKALIDAQKAELEIYGEVKNY